MNLRRRISINFILLNTTSDFADGTVWIEGLDKVTAEKEAQIDLSVKELAKDNETIKSALQKGEYVTAFDISAKLTENNASKEVTASRRSGFRLLCVSRIIIRTRLISSCWLLQTAVV